MGENIAGGLTAQYGGRSTPHTDTPRVGLISPRDSRQTETSERARISLLSNASRLLRGRRFLRELACGAGAGAGTGTRRETGTGTRMGMRHTSPSSTTLIRSCAESSSEVILLLSIIASVTIFPDAICSISMLRSSSKSFSNSFNFSGGRAANA